MLCKTISKLEYINLTRQCLVVYCPVNWLRYILLNIHIQTFIYKKSLFYHMNYFCSQCKCDISEEEYLYSKDMFNTILCRKHQKSQNERQSNKDSEGLSAGESRYKEGMIKGRIAETLIEELFLSLGYNVFRYGMENTVPGIMELLKGVRGEVATNIRRMPDFVIQKDKNVFFVEVKFRASEEFSITDLPKEYPFENCYFIIVSKKHIKCITYQELINGDKISPEDRKYLGSRKEFDLDKNVIIDFCDFAVKFFSEA